MKTVGAYEAKTHFAQLLDEVEQGKTIVITRHGVPVAVLKPPTTSREVDVEASLAELRELSRGWKLGDMTIRELIEEGRRY